MAKTPEGPLDILKFAPISPVPVDRLVLLSVTPEAIAQIAANGMGLAFCSSENGPDAMWAEVTRPAAVAIARV